MRGPGRLEVGLAGAALLAFAAVVYGRHAVEGGFLSDDWALHSDVVAGGGFFGALERMLDLPNMSGRPLMALYMTITHTIFGGHMGFHLATAAGLGAVMAWALFLLLRLLGFERLHAMAIAALVLAFPAADSVRLWAGAAAGQLTVSFLLVGLSLAILGFRSSGRRGLVLHGASLSLYLMSLILHESTLFVIGASVLLYRAVTQWRPAIRRWLVDVAGSSVMVLVFTLRASSTWPRQDLDGQIEHARDIYDGALSLLTSVALPLGGFPRPAVLGVLLSLAAAAAAVALRLDPGDPERRRLLRWLGLVGGGGLLVILGYLIYVPAIPYYLPAGTGIANRINVLPSVGFVVIVYGSVVIACLLAFRTVRHRSPLVAAFAVAAAVVLGAGYVDRVREDSRQFQRAYALGIETLRTLKVAVPRPPSGATIYSAGQPIEVAPGVPVFGNTWDMTGAVRVMWDDQSLTALPYFPGTTFLCGADTMAPLNPRYNVPLRARYGKVVLFQAATGRAEVVRGRSQCRAAGAWFQPGPEYPPPES